jgi:uncharacterized protein
MYNRKQIFQGLGQESAFLWGARQTGKSTLLKTLFPETPTFDLLLGDIFERFQRNPSLLREIMETLNPESLVIIAEVLPGFQCQEAPVGIYRELPYR